MKFYNYFRKTRRMKIILMKRNNAKYHIFPPLKCVKCDFAPSKNHIVQRRQPGKQSRTRRNVQTARRQFRQPDKHIVQMATQAHCLDGQTRSVDSRANTERRLPDKHTVQTTRQTHSVDSQTNSLQCKEPHRQLYWDPASAESASVKKLD